MTCNAETVLIPRNLNLCSSCLYLFSISHHNLQNWFRILRAVPPRVKHSVWGIVMVDQRASGHSAGGKR